MEDARISVYIFKDTENRKVSIFFILQNKVCYLGVKESYVRWMEYITFSNLKLNQNRSHHFPTYLGVRSDEMMSCICVKIFLECILMYFTYHDG